MGKEADRIVSATYKIIQLLKLKHQYPEWAFFQELRNERGFAYSGNIRSIDCYAMNLYKGKGHRRIAYEIKVSHADFVNELKNPKKREPFVELSNEFYYVAPKNIIPVEELPEGCGLLELNKSALVTKRRAVQRDIPIDVPIKFVACLLEKQAKVDESEYEKLKIFKYCDRELTKKELDILVEETAKDRIREVKNELSYEYTEKLNNNPILTMINKATGGWYGNSSISEDKVKDLLNQKTIGIKASKVRHSVDVIDRQVINLRTMLDDLESLKEVQKPHEIKRNPRV